MKSETNCGTRRGPSAPILPLICAALSLAALPAAVAARSTGDELTRRGHLGAQFKTGEKTANPANVLIASVAGEGLAAKLGMQPNDALIRVNGHSITTVADLERELRQLRAGDRVALELERTARGKFKLEGVLPEAPREQIQDVEVIYDSVRDARGERLRTILTKPAGAREKLPVIFVAGWLSDDTVEAPAETKDSACLVFRGLAALPNFATMRMDKPGVGDSEGDCAETDFETELSGYRAAFESLGRFDFIDPERVFILGVSNGGGFAPLIPRDDARAKTVRGYAVVGGWAKTWFEHMLEIERRRLGLAGKSPAEVNDAMKNVAAFYEQYLIAARSPGEILGERPELQAIWTGDTLHQYGRPAKFYHQLQRLNLEAAWSRVTAPVLALHGEFDWIMSRDDHEKTVSYLNALRPGQAKFVEVPQMGHTFQRFASMEAAFKSEEMPFDPSVLRILTDWLQEHRDG